MLKGIHIKNPYFKSMDFFVAKMDLVLLLNTDIFLPEDFFDWLIPHFFSHPALFGISPVIKNIHGNKFLEMKKLPFKKRNSLHYLDVISTQVGHSFYLCGGCALIDRLKLLELKGMDEMYSPFYFEDTDLSVRAWLRGWECLYTPEVEVLHCHSITINSFFSETYVKLVFARNKLLFNYLYLNGLNRFFFFLRCYVKFILGKILPSKSRKRFIAAFKMYQKVEERKKTRRELVLINGNSLNEILLKYFPQSNI
jgi:GT2 family glycosyltransferase